MLYQLSLRRVSELLAHKCLADNLKQRIVSPAVAVLGLALLPQA